jgi:hypothetical protein
MCRRFAAALLAAGLCWRALAAAQVPPAAGLPLDDLLKRRDAAAAGELERRFAALTDKIQKQRIAVVLLSRRQADQPYFDYLANFARRAVTSGAPFPYTYDRQGKIVPGEYSAALLNWAASEKAEPGAAAAKAFQEYPMDVYLLGLSGDQRAIPILLQGLEATNFLVIYRSAWGLARLRHVPAVRPIIAAADRQPEAGAQLIARTLVLFNDPEAQAAADRLIPDKQLLAALRSNTAQELNLNIGDP